MTVSNPGVEAVKQLYVEGGRVRSAPSIERGAPLVHTEEEWRERYSQSQRRMRRGLWVLLAIIYIAVLIPIVIATISAPSVPIEVPVFLFVLLSAVIWVPGALAIMLGPFQGSRMPIAGLYEGGVQLWPRLFIPYTEIERLETVERKPGVWIPGGRLVRLHPRFKRKPFPGVEMPGYWALSVEFIGSDGLAELERMISGTGPEDQGPPRLVLYGRRGQR